MDQSPAAKRAREDAVHHGDVAADPPELHWGPDYLHRLFGCLVERVPTLHRDDLIDYLQGLHQGWGSCCSGTDAPRFIYEAIQAWARSKNMTCTFIHILSAECDSAKQRFIQVTGQPRQLFGDLFDVCRDGAMNFITQQREAPDAANEIRVYYIGFSCKTVSGLASSHRTMNTIDDYLGTTGLTFSGLLSILECRQPRFLLAENVAGLTVGNQHVAVEEKLSAAGYVVFSWQNTPLQFGVPQSRPRLWFLAIRVDLLDTANVSQSSLCDLCKSMVDRLRVVGDSDEFSRVIPVEEFLFDDLDPLLVRRHAADLARLKEWRQADAAPTTCDAKWRRKHSLMFSRFGAPEAHVSGWDSSLEVQVPQYPVMPYRDRELLRLAGINYPDKRCLLINTSQSELQAPPFHSPCMTPTGTYWIAMKHRWLEGPEALNLQALWLSPSLRAQFSSKLLQDLAGNAFCGSCCLQATTLQLVVASFLSRCTAHAAVNRDLCFEHRLQAVEIAAVVNDDGEDEFDFGQT